MEILRAVSIDSDSLSFSILLFITMLVAVNTHLTGGDGIMGASHAIESAVVFLCLFLSGAGKHSVHIDWNK